MGFKRNSIEEQNCIAFIARLEQYHPEIAKLIFHIKNESTTAHKKIGINPGIPDYFLPIARNGYHGLFIEFKAPKGKLSKDQVEKIALLREQGYCSEVAYGWEHGVNIVLDYLLSNPNDNK
jgi:hypothetical protein